jgi:hypothetical protein
MDGEEILNAIDIMVELVGKDSKGINDLVNKFNNERSNIDLEKSDVEHYMEGSKLNAAERAQADRMLVDILKRRRKIKISQGICNAIQRHKSSVYDIVKMRDEIKLVIERNNISKYYKPRILKNLNYGKGIIDKTESK